MSTPAERLDMLKPFVHTGAELKSILKQIPNFSHLLAGAQFSDATNVKEGKVVMHLKVEPHLCNPGGNLHGGAAALLIDEVTTFALGVADAEGRLGVTVNLATDYLCNAPMGEIIEIEGRVLKTGKTLAFLEGTIRNPKIPSIIYMKSHHTKFVGPNTFRLVHKL